MIRIKRYAEGEDSEKGVSLVEFAILLPTIIIMITGLFDLSLALVNYLSLTQIVREGVRFGVGLPNLYNETPLVHKVSDISGTDYSDWLDECESTNDSQINRPCGHIVLHRRVSQLLAASNELQFLDLSDYELTSEFLSGGGDTTDMVRVEFAIDYNGLFFSRGGFFHTWRFNISQTGPYLVTRPDLAP